MLLSNSKQQVLVLTIYRPPGQITHSFIQEFNHFLDSIVSTNHNFTICGDFNAPASSSSINSTLQELLDELSFIQHVNTSTHFKGNILDLLISHQDTPNLISNVTTHRLSYSDHYLVTGSISITKPNHTYISSSYRNLSSIDWSSFNNDLINSSLLVSDSLLADKFAVHINDTVLNILDKHAPMRHKSRRKNADTKAAILSDDAIKAKRYMQKNGETPPH